MKTIRSVIQNRIMRAFDRWAQEYCDAVITKLKARGYSYEVLAEKILKYLEVESDDLLVDLGTGAGPLAEHISAREGLRVIGLDIALNMLRMAKRHGNYKGLSQASAEHLPFAPHTVDHVFSTFMLHSVLDQKQALNEILRVMKTGRTGVVVDLCIQPNASRVWRFIKANLHSLRYEYGALSIYRTPDEYSRLLDQQGLKVTAIEQLGLKKEYTHYLFAFKILGA